MSKLKVTTGKFNLVLKIFVMNDTKMNLFIYLVEIIDYRRPL